MMDLPIRIQLRRTKGWRMPPNTVKVDRSTVWGNPWLTGSPGRLGLRTMPSHYLVCLPIDQISAVEAFRIWITDKPEWWMMPPNDMFTAMGWTSIRRELDFQRHAILSRLANLRGKNLACWCKIISPSGYMPCHADVLLSLANNIPMGEVILENTRRAKGETL